jgi:hypothetical protein
MLGFNVLNFFNQMDKQIIFVPISSLRVTYILCACVAKLPVAFAHDGSYTPICLRALLSMG